MLVLAMLGALLGYDASGDEARAQLAAPSLAGDQDVIVFARGGDNDGSEIWLRDLASGEETRLTTNGAFDGEPTISPDGRSIAFTSSRDGDLDVWIMAADGTGARNLTSTTGVENTGPAWSPDGTRVAFSRQSTIWAVRADGTAPQSLGIGADPAWSPDGGTIAFTAGGALDARPSLWLMGADGSNRRQITGGHGGSDLHPDWSPDGRRIAFTSTRNGGGEIMLTDPQQVERPPARGGGDPGYSASVLVSIDAGNGDRASWSPDGQRVAFQASRLVAGSFNTDVYTVDLAGGQARLTNDPAADQAPDWGIKAGSGTGDTDPPVVTVPGDLTIEATSAAGAAVTYAASATDAVDGDTPVECSHDSGAVFPLGTTVVTCMASDAAGNTGRAAFDVTVRDTVAPALRLPSGRTAEATSAGGAGVTFSATAEDAVSGEVAVSCSRQSGATFALGSTRVECAAVDAAGNRATGAFDVEVVDTRGPVLDLPTDLTAEADSSHGSDVRYEVRASDVVDGARPVTCSPASGASFPLGTTSVTCMASDTRGNSSEGRFGVTIRDTAPPTLDLPSTITVDAEGPAGTTVRYTAAASDAVSGGVVVDCTPPSGSVFPAGDSTVRCSATDGSGNRAQGSFTVTVRAPAATVAVVGGVLTYASPTGVPDALSVTLAGSRYAVENPAVRVVAGTGCISESATRAFCDRAGVASASIDVDDRDDAVTIAIDRPSTVDGGAGDDVLRGDDQGNNLFGNAGADILDGAGGQDALGGGPGTDTADYSRRTDRLIVTLDGRADDGATGEADNVQADVENVLAGSGGSILVGNAGPNTLVGGAGLDNLDGGGGADLLRGGGGGSDSASYASRTVPVQVSLDDVANDGAGGEGDNVASDVETLLGGSANDTLIGSGAGNLLRGEDGNDLLDGRGGDARFLAQPGADRFIGGTGVDTVTYSFYSMPVVVTLDGGANDGAAGERDDVGADVENVTGGSANDVLLGNAGLNEFVGGAGDDTLDGGPGSDRLVGDDGVDTVAYGRSTAVTVDLGNSRGGAPGETDQLFVENARGGGGNDVLVGDARANRLQGGPGDDRIDGLGGADLLFGEAGADTLRSVDDEMDLDSCGGGEDLVTIDVLDVADRDCEKVQGG